MLALVVALALGSASAFVAAPAPAASRVVVRDSILETMEGATKPMGVWDPLDLAGLGSETTIAWYRAAEIKHGRVAMFAFVGWLVSLQGITFPGNIATGVPFKSLGKGVDAWVNVPDAGKLQILAFIGLLELTTEAENPHYLKGGRLGYVPGPLRYGKLWDPVGFSTTKKTEEQLSVLRDKELNNGRAAMIGVMSLIAATYVPGSVPALKL